jgi:hypothetical protein
MLANESTRRRSKRKRDESVVVQPPLSPDEVKSLRDFLAFALGHPRLTWYEEGFLNSRKYQLYGQAIWLTDKQQAILQQIKDKLHYDRPDIPLPPIDPDSIEENDDPDGWPVVRDLANQFEDDDELLDWLAEA